MNEENGSESKVIQEENGDGKQKIIPGESAQAKWLSVKKCNPCDPQFKVTALSVPAELITSFHLLLRRSAALFLSCLL